MTSGFDSICGSPLWEDDNATSPVTDDANATDTQPFVFSECFQNTVFVWVPCAYLAVISPIYFYILIRKYDRVIRLGPLNLAKLVCGCLLMAVCAAAMFYRVHLHQQGEPLYPAMLLAPAINFVAMLLATILIEFGRKKGVRSTGVLFVYWFLQTIAGVLTLTATVQQAVLQGSVSSVFHLTMTVLFSLLVFVELILSSCVDRPPDSLVPTPQGQLPPCPETEASFLSNITFWWFTSLIVTGYKKSLEMKDLWLLNPEDNAKEIVPMFETHWKKELEKSQRSRDRLSPREDKEEGIPLHPKKSTEIDEKGNSSMDASPPRVTFKTAGDEKNSEDGGKGCCGCSRKVYKPSLSWALVRAYGGTFFMGSLFKFVHDILMFVSPMLLRELIAFTENKSVPSWKGYTYTFLLFGVAFIQSLILHQYFQRCFVTGMRLRTSIIGTVYKKALKLSNAARRTSTVGEIVNLMSVDAQRFMDLTTYVNMLWSGPFQMCVSLYFLWYTLGPSILAGVAVMILLIPVNAFIAKKNRALQAIQMVHKDSRIKLMNEILNGIKVLKLYAWETSFQQKVLGIRSEELKVMKKSAYLNAASSFTWTCAPFLVCLTTFAVYVLSSEDNILDAEKAFVSLSLFNILRFPMAMLPNTIAGLVQVTVSIKRLRTFLLHEELDPDNVQRVVTGSNAIVIEDATFAWDTESHRAPPPETSTNVDKKDEDDKDTEDDDDKPAVTEEGRVTLQDLNMTIPDGHLVAVVGVVGSGKSSLLSAILGEMEKLRGKVMVKGSVAYVAQQAWIQNAALRDNVLFGRPRAEPEYGRLLDACALAPDLEVLPGGDMTEIGEKGINLSGGQKQRVSLARAVYQDADIYLLDDPLSAVDAHVGKHIFEKVLGPNGILKKKTRLLVTHGISYLPQTDLILVVKNGRVSERGTYRELLDHDGAFAEFLRTYLEQEMMREEEEEDDEMDEAELTIREEILSHIHIGSPKDDTFLSGSREKLNRIRKDTIKSTGSCNTPSLRRRKDPVRSLSSGSEKGSSLHGSRSSLMRHDAKAKEAMANGLGDGNKGEKIIKEETTETGRVKLSVLTAYLRSMRLPICVLIMVLYMVTNGMSLASNFWLSIWSNDKRINGTVDTDLRDMRLGVYGALGLAQGISLLISSFALAIGNIAASVSLHRALLHNILRSPMEFFDVTPVGRVVNRFSKEIDILDTMIPRTLEAFIKCCLHVLECVIVISISTPIFLIIIVPIGIFYFLIQRFYVATSRQLKRLESVSRSPIYSHFGETVQGASTIRAYRQQARFIRESEEAVDKNQICYYPGIVANRWLAVRLEFVGNVIVLFSSLFAVIYRDDLTAGIVGLSISYALNITQVLNWTVRMSSELETNIVSVERIKEYTQTAMEAAWDREDTRPDASWPDKGQLEFKEYSTRYREGLDLVLKDISCNIQPNEKVGIVGRTGAGKSSLTVALFRIIESAGGSISIDGVNIADLGLHDLRSKLTIIPQDPVLFSGSLRMNLDPFDQFSDSDVWAALEHAHLKNYVSSLAEGLQYECTEGGENLSVGQRQLICLARALLRKSRILVLDEATAAVDLETDDLIQSTIREEFSHSTVLTIAHRLNTIMDYNRIIVLDGGRISEMDTPQALLASKTSAFYGMAKDAGLAE